MPLAPHLRAQLTRRFQQTLAAIGAASAPKIGRAWTNLDAYNEDDIATFTQAAAPVTAAAKFAAVRHAAGYYALTAGVRPVHVAVGDVPALVDFRDPFISTWNALKAGESFEHAVAAGLGRTDAVVRDLVTSSARQTGDVVAEKSNLKIVGWERIPDDGACPWCLEVAPGFYNSAESADFGHERCGCTAEPIYA